MRSQFFIIISQLKMLQLEVQLQNNKKKNKQRNKDSKLSKHSNLFYKKRMKMMTK